MNISEILIEERKIWSFESNLEDIVINLTVIIGDLARCARGASKDYGEDPRKELGNLITSTIRWCDDLGYDPHECIELAFEAQRKFVKDESLG